MEEIVSIDGSSGEGGGQILRTALALSSLAGKPFKIYNIRKGRKNPGLQSQHLTSVRATQEISSATVCGDVLGSSSLEFYPCSVTGGNYHFNVSEERGSAGSSSLVLQAILLPLSFARKSSLVTIEGGTHVSWSPSFHYMAQVMQPLFSSLGFSFSFHIEKWGWYPKGGGRILAKISPRKGDDQRWDMRERGALKVIRGISAVSHLPLSIGERQKREALRLLSQRGLTADIDLMEAPSSGVGTFLFLRAECEKSVAGFSSLGKKGKRAEEVGSEATQDLLHYLDSGASLDQHAADQIIPYLASIGGRHHFTTSSLTPHLVTNIWVVRKFFPNLNVHMEGDLGKPGKISLDEKL